MAPARTSSDPPRPFSTVSTPSSGLEVPVLIVGGGPAGLIQAHLLSRLRVPCLIVERYNTRLAAPKAHALSPRTLEISRQAGLDTGKIRQLGTKRNEALYVNFVTNLSGQQVGRLPYERMDAAVLEDTPEMIHNIPQPAFEQLVAAQLRSNDSVELLQNMSFVSCERTANEVLSTVEDRVTGTKVLIRSRHVIACDGARSKVRQFLDIQSEGVDGYEMMMTIHFSCNLRPILGDRVGMLHWIMDPAVSGFIINYDPAGNQVLICNFDADKYPVDSWDDARCREVLYAAIGQKADFEVLSWRPWVLSRKVAEEYRQGNVLLAGDAAHSFPPTGGLGLNSGIADVHNLAWKIAAVHQGWATDSLLDTYESDRQQVALVNAQQSVKNGEKIFSFLKSLGATVSDVTKARQNLLDTVNDPAQAGLVAAHIEGQREHFDNLGLHIGYVYGRKTIPKSASVFTPEYAPGARLPHAWIRPLHHAAVTNRPIDLSFVSELTASELAARQFSTLDLCALDSFTLITTQGSDWFNRIAYLKRAVSPKIPLRVLALGIDFEMIQDTASGREWIGKSGLASGSAILVRPDQHILTTFSSQTSPEELVKSLHGYLGLSQ